MKRIAVFCGSSHGFDELYSRSAYELGHYLAEQHIQLVYGGAKIGLMGDVANGALEKGGEVIGVLPVFLKEKELAHDHLTQLICVDSMHQRKLKMHELSDGVIAIPGGFGTLEEYYEMLTWGQLGLHQKPVAILNINGFFDPLIAMAAKMMEKGFLKQSSQHMMIIDQHIPRLIEKMNNYQAPVVDKWINKEQI